MAGRNSSGTFSSSIADFQTGTVIRSNDVNTVRDEFATEITDSLSRSAKGGMLAALKLYDGSAAIPSLTFSAQEGIGFYRAGNYDLRFVCDAAEKFRLTNLGAKVTGTLEVTGTGTHAAATFSGDVTVDTDTLKVDTTNDRVGVGTAAPNCKLAVGHAGVVDAGIPVQINAGSAAEQYFSANKGGSLGFLLGYSNGGTYGTRAMLRNVPNDPLSIYVNGSSHVAEFHTTGIRLYTSNPAGTTAQTNNLTPANIPKAWATIDINAGTLTVLKSFNVTSASINGSGNILITFASAFADADYACGATAGNSGTGYSMAFANPTTTTVELAASSTFTGSTRKVYVWFMGLQ